MPPSIALDRGAGHPASTSAGGCSTFPEVEATLSRAGPPRGRHRRRGRQHERDLRAPEAARSSGAPGWTKDALVEAMRASLDRDPGRPASTSRSRSRTTSRRRVSGVRGKVVLKIFGNDLEKMRDDARGRQGARSPRCPGIVDLDLYRDSMVPQLQIVLDRAALARAGHQRRRRRRTWSRPRSAGNVATEHVGGRAAGAGAGRCCPRAERDDAERIGALAGADRRRRRACRCARSPDIEHRRRPRRDQPRGQQPLPGAQVQRRGPRHGLGGQRGAGAVVDAQGQAARRPLLRVGRRVREPAARDGAAARSSCRSRC